MGKYYAKRSPEPDPSLTGDDNLEHYFKTIAKRPLMTAEAENALSADLIGHEQATWSAILDRPAHVRKVLVHLELVEHLSEFVEAAESNLSRKKYLPIVGEVSVKIRLFDLDRDYTEEDRDLVNKVVRDISKLPFEKKQRAEILRLHAKSNELRRQFIESNLRLVVKKAKGYDRGLMSLSDMIQEANLGLMHAVSRFDPKRGLRLSTYACWWIRHGINRAIADKGRNVRIPVYMLEQQAALEKSRQRLTIELGRPPEIDELAAALKTTVDKLHGNQRCLLGQPVSLQSTAGADHGGSEITLEETLIDPDSEERTPLDQMNLEKLQVYLPNLMQYLSPLELAIIKDRFGFNDGEVPTLDELGEQKGLSRERIRQIQNGALEKLKRALERELGGEIDL